MTILLFRTLNPNQKNASGHSFDNFCLATRLSPSVSKRANQDIWQLPVAKRWMSINLLDLWTIKYCGRWVRIGVIKFLQTLRVLLKLALISRQDLMIKLAFTLTQGISDWGISHIVAP